MSPARARIIDRLADAAIAALERGELVSDTQLAAWLAAAIAANGARS